MTPINRAFFGCYWNLFHCSLTAALFHHSGSNENMFKQDISFPNNMYVTAVQSSPTWLKPQKTCPSAHADIDNGGGKQMRLSTSGQTAVEGLAPVLSLIAHCRSRRKQQWAESIFLSAWHVPQCHPPPTKSWLWKQLSLPVRALACASALISTSVDKGRAQAGLQWSGNCAVGELSSMTKSSPCQGSKFRHLPKVSYCNNTGKKHSPHRDLKAEILN